MDSLTDKYQFAYFLRKADPHYVLLKVSNSTYLSMGYTSLQHGKDQGLSYDNTGTTYET